jgi:hypothetical protein
MSKSRTNVTDKYRVSNTHSLSAIRSYISSGCIALQVKQGEVKVYLFHAQCAAAGRILVTRANIHPAKAHELIWDMIERGPSIKISVELMVSMGSNDGEIAKTFDQAVSSEY